MINEMTFEQWLDHEEIESTMNGQGCWYIRSDDDYLHEDQVRELYQEYLDNPEK